MWAPVGAEHLPYLYEQQQEVSDYSKYDFVKRTAERYPSIRGMALEYLEDGILTNAEWGDILEAVEGIDRIEHQAKIKTWVQSFPNQSR